jgi:hypothetical protein
MVRTQIYLTEAEHHALRTLSHRTGRSQSELIRDAIDEMLATQEPANRQLLLRQARGMWAARTDLPNVAQLRSEFERHRTGLD